MPKTKKENRIRQGNRPPQSAEAQENYDKNNRKKK